MSTQEPPVSQLDRRATMNDIARAAGVSQSTVSRILSNAALPIAVSDATRARVEKTAELLGYRPNLFARALRGAPSMLLGAIVRDITDPFFATATEALSIKARELGYNIALGLFHNRASEPLELAGVFEPGHCDAMVILGDMHHQPRLLAELRAQRLPVVAVWQNSQLHGIPAVNVDNVVGVTAAVKHLQELGHGRIALITSQLFGPAYTGSKGWTHDIRERQAAFCDAVGTVPAHFLQHVPNSPAGGQSALENLLKLRHPPTAVITSTDVLAMGVLHAAHAKGLVVPRDLSVVGFDDIPFASFTVPALTTLRMPITAMVSTAAELAVAAARSANGAKTESVVPPTFVPELIIRDSTAPPSALRRSSARGRPRRKSASTED